MTGRRILCLINFFPPAAGGGVYRPLSFVKYLSRETWDVTVVTPRPGGFWISDASLEEQVPSGVRVVRTGSISGQHLLSALGAGTVSDRTRRPSASFGCLRRLGEYALLPDTYVGWVPFAVRAAARLCRAEKFDVLYSTSPPDSTHLAASSIARRFPLRWVADFRDPWISLHLRTPPTSLHRRLLERMERRAAGADLVLVTTRWQEQRFGCTYPRSTVERIPNGFDEEDFGGLDGAQPDQGPFTILHSGMLTLGRSSRPFLEGLSLFVRRSGPSAREIRVLFLGARESENEQWVRQLALGQWVAFEGNRPHGECVLRERKSHVLLLIKHDDTRYNGLVPGKLYEYIGARRPILAVVPEGEAADIVSGLRRGEVARIGDPEDVAQKLSRMHSLHLDGRLESSYSLDAVPEFSRKTQARRLSEVMQRMLEEQ